jgi:hypothetical protein
MARPEAAVGAASKEGEPRGRGGTIGEDGSRVLVPHIDHAELRHAVLRDGIFASGIDGALVGCAQAPGVSGRHRHSAADRRIAWRGRQASGESRTTKRSAVAAGAREGVVAMMVVVTAVSFTGRAVLCRRGRDQQRDCRREQHPLTA